MVQHHIADATTSVGMIGVLASVWANMLPSAVSLVTLLWFVIKIYETDTFQKLVRKKTE